MKNFKLLYVQNFKSTNTNIAYQVDIKKKCFTLLILLSISSVSNFQVNIVIVLLSLYIICVNIVNVNYIINSIKYFCLISILTIINFFYTVQYILFNNHKLQIIETSNYLHIYKLTWSFNIGLIIFLYLLLTKLILLTTLPENLISFIYKPMIHQSNMKDKKSKMQYIVIITIQIVSIIFKYTYYIFKIIQIRAHSNQDQNINSIILIVSLLIKNLIYKIFSMASLISSILHSKSATLINSKCLTLWKEQES